MRKLHKVFVSMNCVGKIEEVIDDDPHGNWHTMICLHASNVTELSDIIALNVHLIKKETFFPLLWLYRSWDAGRTPVYKI